MAVVTKQKRKGVKKLTGDIFDQIQPIEFDDYLKMNLYGKSGTGKTSLWSSFPGPILGIITSGSNKSGELRSISKATIKKNRIEQFPLQDPDQIREIVKAQRDSGRFKTLVVDHISSLQDQVLKSVLGLDEAPTQLSWGLATQQQYGTLAHRMKDYMRDLLGLENCNIVFVAQERVFEPNNEDSELDLLPYVASAVSPSIVGWLNPAVDYICETFIQAKTAEKTIKVAGKTKTKTIRLSGVEYCLRTGPSEVYTTKFRKPHDSGIDLPEYIVDPTYDKIMKLIQGE